MHRLFENKLSSLRFLLLLSLFYVYHNSNLSILIYRSVFIFVVPLCHFIIIHDDTFLLCSWIISVSTNFHQTLFHSNNHDQLTLTSYTNQYNSLVSIITCTNVLTCFCVTYIQITQHLLQHSVGMLTLSHILFIPITSLASRQF